MKSLKKRKKQEQYRGRFYWGGNEENMWIELVMLTEEQIKEIVKDCTTTRIDFPVNPKTYKMERVESSTVDEKKLIDVMLDKTLSAWGNFDLEGETLDCTLENKKMLVEEVEGFAAFYAESLTQIKKDAKERFGGRSEQGN